MRRGRAGGDRILVTTGGELTENFPFLSKWFSQGLYDEKKHPHEFFPRSDKKIARNEINFSKKLR